MRHPTVGELFEKKPSRWGLRGDPYLWSAMRDHLAETPLPASASTFVKTIEDAFLQLTAMSLASDDSFHLKNFSRGGMSSGGINPQFWFEEALPLLLARYSRAFTAFQSISLVPSEKTLDRALELGFQTQPDFVRWFLSKTKFHTTDATYHWSRSDHPWSRVEMETTNPTNGQKETVVRESETDLLVILNTRDQRRIGLHIENKLESGRFTPLQPESYAARAAMWKQNTKYENYQNWETVLVAPKRFLARHGLEAAKFNTCISHEDISMFLADFTVRS